MGWGGVVACRIIVSAPVPFLFLWTFNFEFGTWNWNLDFGLGLGTGLGLDNIPRVKMFFMSLHIFRLLSEEEEGEALSPEHREIVTFLHSGWSSVKREMERGE